MTIAFASAKLSSVVSFRKAGSMSLHKPIIVEHDATYAAAACASALRKPKPAQLKLKHACPKRRRLCEGKSAPRMLHTRKHRSLGVAPSSKKRPGPP